MSYFCVDGRLVIVSGWEQAKRNNTSQMKGRGIVDKREHHHHQDDNTTAASFFRFQRYWFWMYTSPMDSGQITRYSSGTLTVSFGGRITAQYRALLALDT